MTIIEYREGRALRDFVYANYGHIVQRRDCVPSCEVVYSHLPDEVAQELRNNYAEFLRIAEERDRTGKDIPFPAQRWELTERFFSVHEELEIKALRRLVEANQDKIVIRRCPQCSRILIRPRFQECMWCGHQLIGRVETSTDRSASDAPNEPRIPSVADWQSERWNLETAYAYRNFVGMDLDEAFDACARRHWRAAEDLCNMPAVCLRYYIHAFIDYLLSDRSAGDASGASMFLMLVEHRRKAINISAEPLRRRVREVLNRVRNEPQWFDPDPDEFSEDLALGAEEVLKLTEC